MPADLPHLPDVLLSQLEEFLATPSLPHLPDLLRQYGKTPLDWALWYRKAAAAALLQADPRVGAQVP